MKKVIVYLLLLLLLLFLITGGKAVAESLYKDITLADMLEEKYGITILTSSECLDIPTPDTFTIGKKYYSPFLSMLAVNQSMQELEIIEKALECYPDGFFKYFQDSRCPKGLRILLADEIIESDSSQHYQGYAYYAGSYYNLWLESGNFDPLTVHHELWHSLENVILNVYPNAFSLWDQVNPKGFQYLDDFTADRSGFDPDYFVRAYGIITPQEDRATLIEAAFYDNRDEWFAKKPYILRKLLYLNAIIHVVMDYQYEINY